MDSSINTLSVSVRDATGNIKNGNITLTPGNYNATSILTELSTQLTTFCQTSSGTYVGYTPVTFFSYNTNTGLTSLSLKFGYNITLNFSTNLSFGGFFGFTTNQTFNSSTTVTSSSIVVTNPIYCLFLRSPNLIQYNNKEFIVSGSSDIISNIIYRVPISTQTGTYIQYILNTDPFFISNTNISQFQFLLTNCINNTAVDLQSLAFQFKFSVVEYEIPSYEPISQIAYQIVSTETIEDIEDMKDEHKKLLKKLERYKSILEKNKIKEPGEIKESKELPGITTNGTTS
jgi:hypothetical protein